jgi:hypothetical protein
LAGNDSNTGAVDRPLRTIQKAVDLARPGTTILVRGGTYAVSANIQIRTSGTAAKPITLANQPGERAGSSSRARRAAT